MKYFRFRFIELLFAVFFVVLIFISYLSYQRINGLILASELVSRSASVKLKLEQASSYLKDAETSQRGYLLSSDSTFLEPFYGAFENAHTLIHEVDSLTKDDSVQHKNIVEFQSLINVRYDFLNIVMVNADSVKRARGLTPYLILGKKTMDNIRTRISSMIEWEDEVFARRIERRNYFARFSPIFLLGLSIFTLGVGIVSLLKIKRDTARLRVRDAQLTTKNIELENSNAELASFSYVASHDLKDPLRKIQLFSERILLKENDQLSAAGKEDFKRVVSSVKRMDGLLDALLDFSRAKTTENVFEPTDLNTILEEVKVDLKEIIEEKKAIIESATLPVIPVVPVQFRQLFTNLISNSIKYSKPDVVPHIKITANKINSTTIKPGGWDIIFDDNGIGFEQKYEPKIFQIFQRLHGRSEYSGTGIGLAICKRIVVNHHGTISAKGQLDKGATFQIFIPVN